jgi:hypothetical protein
LGIYIAWYHRVREKIIQKLYSGPKWPDEVQGVYERYISF